MSSIKKKGFYITKNGLNSSQLWLDKQKLKNAKIKPKKPMTNQMFFQSENLLKLRAQTPNLKLTEADKLSKAEWNQMNDE